ncbi:MAG: hypothetical protein JNJ46_27905 [Myxococcales bacterium]|nr:hypothetical protein [Myxococcales bacterium]
MPNKVQLENALLGTDQWKLINPVPLSVRNPNDFSTGALEGYASLTSVNVGGDISLYVRSTAPTFSIDIYRMGYYNNLGGRLMKSIPSVASVVQPMPAPQDSNNYGLVECDWIESYRLTVPTDWVSGVYLAKLTAHDENQWQCYIIFVVREDERPSDVLMQCSVNTYQAYNGWGGRSIYHSYCVDEKSIYTKVSFNRPYFAAHRGYAKENNAPVTPYARGAGHLFAHFPFGVYEQAWEYNMIRWLEKNGYDVTYCTNIDVHRDAMLLLSHRAFISVGHDEYWSREMRVNVEMARDQGVDLLICGGNSIYRQVRLESDAHGNPYRTLVCHKPDTFPAVVDPVALRIKAGAGTEDDLYPYPNVTGEFKKIERYEVDVDWPEATLTGSTWNGGAIYWEDLTVKAPADWIYNGSNAVPNQTLSNMAGYEVDGDMPNSVKYAPPNRRILASSATGGLVQAYAVDGGATVFSAGTIHWSWGLDDWAIEGCSPDNGRPASITTDAVVQRITSNLLARAVQNIGAEAHFFGTYGSGSLAPLGQVSGLRVKWRMIPGSFSAPQSTDALFYDPTTGEAQFYTLQKNGPQISLVPIGGLFRGWRKSLHIIAGTFSNSGLTDLLFFDRATGEAQFYRTDGKGNLLPSALINLQNLVPNGAPHSGWRRTWQIIPGHFGGNPSTNDLLIYNPARGELQFYATNGQGGILPLGGLRTGFRRRLQIVPGQFRTRATANPVRTDLLFYDPINGDAEFMEADGIGGVSRIGSPQSGWRKGWRIIPGIFGGTTQLTDLLLYEPATGDAHFFASNGEGGILPIGGSISGWRRTWQIVPFKFRDWPQTDLLFFDSFATVP